MSATVKPARKFPPLCWTRDEALVLIEAYGERWYALHRAFLRNPDWDAVAEKVTTSCPDVTPPKTSAQCRHKMEKLRQRHRAEKQRASSFPGGRFFSSWFYFEAMEAMENGPNAEPGNNHSNNQEISIATPVNPGRFKPSALKKLVTISTNHIPNFDYRVSNHKSSYTDNWSNSNHEDDNDDVYLVNSAINETSSHPPYKNHNETAINETTKLFQGSHQNENNWNPNLDQGKKRGNGGIHEVVSSIKLLGDGFMKMEKMKIDMAREIERMRMETEMKRNQLILESQKQIVDAFVKGLIEMRNSQEQKQWRIRSSRYVISFYSIMYFCS